jgi:hypothetical protein
MRPDDAAFNWALIGPGRIESAVMPHAETLVTPG